MPNKQETQDFGGELSIYNAEDLKQNLLLQLSMVEQMELDLSSIHEIDSAGIQVLLLLKREAIAQGKTLKLVKHSTSVMQLFELYNLGSYFGDPLVLPLDHA